MSKVFLPLIGGVFFVVGWGTSQTPSVQIGTWNLGFFTDLNPATGQYGVRSITPGFPR
jgi:hypothetical protein